MAGTVLGAAAALIGGVALLWRRSRPVGVLVVCVAEYAVNAAVVPGCRRTRGGSRCMPRAFMAAARAGRGIG